MPVKKLLAVLALMVVIAVPSPAAIASTAQFDVRTTGSDSAGGAFDSGVASPGTDFSQGAIQTAYTDLVIGGTTTQVTSVAHPFGSTAPGNLIDIISGSGCTTGRFEVISVSGITATVDRSTGTAASVCTANLGGSLLTIGTAGGVAVTGNTIHVQSGTYTVTTGATLTVASGNIALIGYGSTHNDGGTAPLMTTSTNSITLLTLAGGFITTNVAFVSNINFSSTAGTPGIGIAEGSGGPGLVLRNSKISGCSKGVDGATSGNFPAVVIESSEITGSTTWGVLVTGGQSISITDSYIHGNGGAGTGITTGGLSLVAVKVIELERSIITANAGVNVLFPSGSVVMTLIRDCTIAGATGSGGSTVGNGSGICFNLGLALPYVTLRNNIIYGNAGWGVFSTNSSQISYQGHGSNAYGGNTQGARGSTGTGTTIASGTGDVTLTANPFTNSGAGDYSLNATAGGGAACKGTGYPGAFPAGTSTGYLDIGPVQSVGSTASASAAAFAY